MSMKFLSSLDLGQNELQNVRIQNLGADPGSPVPGQIWFNSATFQLKLYDGVAIRVLAGLQNKITDFAAPTVLAEPGQPDHPEPGRASQPHRRGNEAVCRPDPVFSSCRQQEASRTRATGRAALTSLGLAPGN